MTTERPRPSMRNPPNADFPTGPALGEALPDFVLPDQHGTATRLHEVRGDGRVFLVFIRATSW